MRFWIVIPSGGAIFEIRHGYSAYKVDLDAHSCSCRLWEISGLPCVHAQATINFIHKDPVDLISFWELGHNKLSCKNGEGLSDHDSKRKSRRLKEDGGWNSTVNIAKTPRKAGGGNKKDVEGTSKEESEGKMKVVEGTSKEVGKMIDVDQSISHLKRMKMMARRGGKIKYVGGIGVVHGSLSQTVAVVDEVVITCHEKLDQEDFETIKDLQASRYDHGEIAEAFNKRKEMLVESIVDEATIQETQDPLVRKRKPSERIIKIKLKKAVHDPDGGGSTTGKAITLD
ncbi:unnamed protein product [Lactuca virosa]|uniref:SWIM-type domain-containing protein n=1 Tax=Lactuca virosa TaxID=75947 RepID=A0AAU9PQK7_9ASTR|nr:unnamed protein product [Lactuca virosa]